MKKANAMRLAALVLAAVQLLSTLFNKILLFSDGGWDTSEAVGIYLFHIVPMLLLLLYACGALKRFSRFLFASAAVLQAALCVWQLREYMWRIKSQQRLAPGPAQYFYQICGWLTAVCCLAAAVIVIRHFKPRLLSRIVGILILLFAVLTSVLRWYVFGPTSGDWSFLLDTKLYDLFDQLHYFAPFALCLFAGESDTPLSAADYRGAARWITLLAYIPFLILLRSVVSAMADTAAYSIIMPILLFSIFGVAATVVLFFALRCEKSRLYLPSVLLLAVSYVELARGSWAQVRLSGGVIVDLNGNDTKPVETNLLTTLGRCLPFVCVLVLIGALVFVLAQIMLKRDPIRAARITAIVLCVTIPFIYSPNILQNLMYWGRYMLLGMPIVLWLFGQTRTAKVSEADTVTPSDETLSTTE